MKTLFKNFMCLLLIFLGASEVLFAGSAKSVLGEDTQLGSCSNEVEEENESNFIEDYGLGIGVVPVQPSTALVQVEEQISSVNSSDKTKTLVPVQQIVPVPLKNQLYDAVKDNDLSLVITLLKNGADPNECIQLHNTNAYVAPLHLATRVQNGLKIAEVLLQYGADPLLKTQKSKLKTVASDVFVELTPFDALLLPEFWCFSCFGSQKYDVPRPSCNISDEDRIKLGQLLLNDKIDKKSFFRMFDPRMSDINTQLFLQLGYPRFTTWLAQQYQQVLCEQPILNDLSTVFDSLSLQRNIDKIQECIQGFTVLLNAGAYVNKKVLNNSVQKRCDDKLLKNEDDTTLVSVLDVFLTELQDRDRKSVGINIQGNGCPPCVTLFIKILLLYGAQSSGAIQDETIKKNHNSLCQRYFPDCFVSDKNKLASALYLQEIKQCTSLQQLLNCPMPQSFSAVMQFLPILYVAYNYQQKKMSFEEAVGMCKELLKRANTLGALSKIDLHRRLVCTLGDKILANGFMIALTSKAFNENLFDMQRSKMLSDIVIQYKK